MFRSLYPVCLFFLSLILMVSCGTSRRPYFSDEFLNWKADLPEKKNKHIHSLYLIGDGGELDDTIQNRNFVFDAAADMLREDSVKTSLVFLGDNIYPHGLPKSDDPYRDMAERILDAQLDMAGLHKGKTYFIPGNHDWNKHKKGGRKAILRQEEYVRSYKDSKHIKFYPKNACGDPEVVKIHKDLVFIFLDSQWWLQDWNREKKINHKCDIRSRADLLDRIEEVFIEYKNDEIVVLMHHPVKSNGKHGGKYNLRHHLFPLTEINPKLWIPLPIIGSFYPIYRNVTGSKQDITNVKNQDLVYGIQEIARNLRINVIFSSGHDHGMQYFDDHRIKYIVSGGGSRTDYTQKGGDAGYARDARGFARIEFYANNESWLEIYTIEGFGSEPVLEFATRLRAPRKGTVEEEQEHPPVSDKKITVAANESFAAGPFKKFFLGAQYRDIWATPVEAEVIDLESKHGGLTPIKKGGGMASHSLRMEKKDGKQYILRSIKKDYTKLVPPEFDNLKLIDLIADQNSASHPYNALILPSLSRAAGIYYTEPKLVYLKHQRGLGNYNSQFEEELYLLEERPSGNWGDDPKFGNSEDIISYADLLDILRTKKNHFVDQEWVLRSRIFDLLIHDWDRHDDQWRWARFEEDGRNIYRPIPRDRDQAFYKFKGVIPWYIANFIIKKFKTMKEDVKDVKHLSFNASAFDRYFLHELAWDDWERIITQMQEDISDSEIDKAIMYFPEEIMHLPDVKELPGLLKSRRDNLLKIGRRLYDFISDEVEISGSDNDDRFEVIHNSDGSIELSMFVERKNKEDLLKYKRVFYPEETNELRLYGLRGEDSFEVTGVSHNNISLRIIGGEDDDVILNKVTERRVYGYDSPDGMRWEGEVVDKRTESLDVNEYDREGFKYNTNFPFISFGNTVDDGFWFGGSLTWTKHAWRKDPYHSNQMISISVAPGSQDAIQFSYNAHFTDMLGTFDFTPLVNMNFPEYENYFGLGGLSNNPLRETEYHWVRMKNIDIEPLLRLKLGKSSHFDLGPVYRNRNIEATSGRVSDEANEVFTEDALRARNYLGAAFSYGLSFVDNKVFPSNGFSFSASFEHLLEIAKDEDVSELALDAQIYIQLLSRPKLVLANNSGFMISYGDRQFYHYTALGNNKGLRGFRNERFRGTSAIYNMLDLRLRLVQWNNNILPMDIGLLGGFDNGKVILDDGQTDPWHSSHTLGLWFEILGSMVIQPYYSFNDEQNTFSLLLGFNF